MIKDTIRKKAPATPPTRASESSAIGTFLAHLKSERGYHGQIAHVHQAKARPARFGKLSHGLHPSLLAAMGTLGIGRLYAHQTNAINALHRGKSVVVSTGTSSGKSLCYTLPVLDEILRNPDARALYLFPTKALAQDQLRVLGTFARLLPKTGLSYGTYDGDTGRDDRTNLRQNAQIILTNPDMLSVGILPNYHLWRSYFEGLRYIVVDEAHMYRGVFGSHVACILRRLLRICARMGRVPQFVLCSATIANPGEHATALTSLPVEVIMADGAPHGPRTFVLWNPPVVNASKNIRRSANTEAAGLFAELVRAGLRNITFARSRRSAELILSLAKEQLQKTSASLVRRVASYRAGYLADDRRSIERALFEGRLIGVTATNALELGIDIGGLDAAVLVGFPGSIASVWQQAGRAGRGTREALSILVADDNPLDQYFIQHPDKLFNQVIENALVDPDNPYILEQQLPAAAREVPLTNGDEQLFGPGFIDAMIRLERAEVLEYDDDRWTYGKQNYPAQAISLRAASGRRIKLVLEDDPRRVIEEIDAEQAARRAHDGAVYLHQGDTYLVTELDMAAGLARVKPVDSGYYTEPREVGQTYILAVDTRRQAGAVTASTGRVRVMQRIIGYRRKQFMKDEVLVDVALDYPPQSFETVALWWDVPPAGSERLKHAGRDLAGSLHAVEHVCAAVLPLFAMCDRMDIGSLATQSHPDTGKPQVMLYDACAGGIGISEQGFRIVEKIWQAALDTITLCACKTGCPACIQSPRCGTNNQSLDKRGAALLLRAMLGQAVN